MGIEQVIADNAWVITLVAFLVIPIKGYALWISARKSKKWWFIALLVVNSLGILELIYLLAIEKVHIKKEGAKKPKEEEPKIPDAPQA